MLTIAENIKGEPKSLIGKRIAVLGISGSGKSNTAAVIVEELAPHVPFTVIDREGEMWGLKELGFIVVGKSRHVDLEVTPVQAAALARFSYTEGVSLVVDVSDYRKSEREEFLIEYLSALWACSEEQDNAAPYMLLVEEAHEFMPQSGRHNADLKDILVDYALRGRKRGFGMVIVSQRSHLVTKDVLTQASILFLHQVTHPRDMAIYREFIPLPAGQVKTLIAKLVPGEAVVIMENQHITAHIRLRKTFHPSTGLQRTEQPPLRPTDNSALDKLRDLLKVDTGYAIASSVKTVKPAHRWPARKMHIATDTAKLLREKDAQIKELQDQIVAFQMVPQAVSGSTTQAIAYKKTTTRSIVTTKIETDSIEIGAGFASKRLVDGQTRKFNKLLVGIIELAAHEKAMLVFLMDSPGVRFYGSEVARRLGYSLESYSKKPPKKLLKTGLVAFDDNRQFMSTAHTHLIEMFPDLIGTKMLSQIVATLK